MTETADADTPRRDDAVRELLADGSEQDLRMFLAGLSAQEMADLLETLADDERERLFPLLDTQRQANVLREVEGDPARESLMSTVPDAELADIFEQVPSDDAADLVESVPEERRERVLGGVEPESRAAIEELQRYPSDTAGGLMQKEFLKVREDQTVGQAIETIRRDWDPKIGDVYDLYVVDEHDHLLGRVRNRHLVIHPPHRKIAEFMLRDVRTVPVTMDQERIAEIVADYDLSSIAVVDDRDRIVGRILVDDIVDVLEEEATEDFQKAGGTEALGDSYLNIRLPRMVRKRVVWLAILFVGETMTASAMKHFDEEIARATVLALFLPLIISSGGNSGSQASTLVIRAMALGEVRIRDWWKVVRREFLTGLALGAILGVLGAALLLAFHGALAIESRHAGLVAATVGVSILGVVLWGTLVGSALPFVLRRLGFDPASASAPFVATLVDVSGVVIYFVVALILLRGTLL